MQIELSAEGRYDQATSVGVSEKREETEAAFTATFGVHENLDFVMAAPYLWYSSRSDDEPTVRENGPGDITIDLKWRFFEENGWGLALKPGIILPTGDDKKGLGGGRMTYRLFLIASKELSPWAFHVNLGYLRNENSAGDRTDLWYASAAAEMEVIRNLKVVANVGLEQNPAVGSNDHPAFALGGVVYAISDRFSVDAGVKFGLTSSETDWTYLLGVTYKF